MKNILIKWLFVSASVIFVTSSASALTCTSLTKSLSKGSKNSEVFKLQQFLFDGGYLTTKPTGYFGVLTVVAVKKFQGSNELSQVGSVGPATRSKIKEISCSNNGAINTETDSAKISINTPEKISSFPENSTSSKNILFKSNNNNVIIYEDSKHNYSIIEDYNQGGTVFKNLKTGEEKKITEGLVDFAFWNDTILYIVRSKNADNNRTSEILPVFELRQYYFNQKKEYTLIPKIYNEDNGNSPHLDLMGDLILIAGFGNNISLINVSTGEGQITKLKIGEISRPQDESEKYLSITPGLYSIIPDHVFFIDKNLIIFEADDFVSGDSIFTYDITKNIYKKIHTLVGAGKTIITMFYSGDYVYWSEPYGENYVYFRMKVN